MVWSIVGNLSTLIIVESTTIAASTLFRRCVLLFHTPLNCRRESLKGREHVRNDLRIVCGARWGESLSTD